MQTPKHGTKGLRIAILLALAILLLPQFALAHCDALDGPVITDARTALADGEVAPVLKWVTAEDEEAIRAAFSKTLAVRELNADARALADRYFFETLVRIHRASEGAAYTGLKPAGNTEPVIAKADRALEQGSVDALAKSIAAHTQEGVHERFQHALETKKHAAESVAAGREFVAAYVTYVHYVEGVAKAVHGAPHHTEAASSSAHQH